MTIENRDRTDDPVVRARYDPFLDASGSWTVDVREYRDDLDSIVPVDVPPDPGPQEAYRVAVFLDGFIQEQRNAANWSDGALDRFDSFDSTVEAEAVARALRHIGGRADR
jgi:hypothetical protein